MKSLPLILFSLTLGVKCTFAQDNVSVNSAVQYQTITGWGHGGGILGGTQGAYSM